MGKISSKSDRAKHAYSAWDKILANLHDKYNRRVVGYDNAHGIKTKRGRFSGTRTVWDHKHDKQKVRPYEFEGALSLMEDFWKDVNKQILQ